LVFLTPDLINFGDLLFLNHFVGDNEFFNSLCSNDGFFLSNLFLFLLFNNCLFILILFCLLLVSDNLFGSGIRLSSLLNGFGCGFLGCLLALFSFSFLS